MYYVYGSLPEVRGFGKFATIAAFSFRMITERICAHLVSLWNNIKKIEYVEILM